MWLYKNEVINDIKDFPENCFGFVYKITHKSSQHFYIGKKYLYHSKKHKLTKKQLAEQTGKGRKPTFEVIKKESDWKTYWSSSLEIKAILKKQGEEEFIREILEFGFNSKHLNYLETKYQFALEVLENPFCFNDNIAGRYFRKDLVIK